ncbi:hypothetical protein FRB94_006124 [Tulasnella sp. JGI-2019a]|nr:hypothetical protein FRB94_006124 [Tulasnella sp. JGI-2019a]
MPPQPELLTLGCIKYHDDIKSVQIVKILRSELVATLRAAIATQFNISIVNLELFKPTPPIEDVQDTGVVNQKLRGIDISSSEHAQPLDNGLYQLSEYFPDQVVLGVHIIFQVRHIEVQPPKPFQSIHDQPKRSGPPPLTDDLIPRTALIDTLLKKLDEYHVIQVRGTPASGKTSLCRLLYHELLERCEGTDSEIYMLSQWPKDDPEVERFRRAVPKWFNGPVRYILFDEAQSSYWDRSLWNDYFKTIMYRGTSIRLVLFCIHDNPSYRPYHLLELAARITLRLTSTSDIGLLLTRPEYNELLKKSPKRIHFVEDLKDAIYEWTAGHVGAVVSVLLYIHHDHAHEMEAGKCFTLDDYYSNHLAFLSLPEYFVDSVAGRGIPPARGFQTHAPVFKRMLKEFFIDTPVVSQSGEEKALELCHDEGWINLNLLGNARTRTTRYTFASPLHISCVSWFLQFLPSPTPLLSKSIYELAIKVIKHFRPSQLANLPRRLRGGFDDCPPESQYQREFYRRLLECCPSSVAISPEFASASSTHRVGHIDFFIPEKKWGILCIRDGDHLADYNKRFECNGAYEEWLSLNDMDDFILLDFRGGRPTEEHPGLRNLYHIVVNDRYSQVDVLDNGLKPQGRFALVESD